MDHGSAVSLPEMMKAVVYADYGEVDVLQLQSISSPAVGTRKVVIRVQAAGVNPIDYRLRRGEARWLMPGRFPRIPGYDVAGEVVFAPPQCGLEPGQRVMAFLDDVYGGGYAEFASCHPTSVALIPETLSFEEAAAIPLAGSTALQSLRDHGRLRRGDRVLVNGASGGVGVFAVQIAKACGAHVTAVASGRNESLVRSLGADQFYDYQVTDFTRQQQHWNLIFDAAGKSSYLHSRAVLAGGGRYVSTEPSLPGALTRLFTRFLSKSGTFMLARPNHDDLRELVRLYETGQLKIVLDEVLDLHNARQAHRKIQDGVDHGKIVLRVDER